jgi:hypothetical protein
MNDIERMFFEINKLLPNDYLAAFPYISSLDIFNAGYEKLMSQKVVTKREYLDYVKATKRFITTSYDEQIERLELLCDDDIVDQELAKLLADKIEDLQKIYSTPVLIRCWIHLKANGIYGNKLKSLINKNYEANQIAFIESFDAIMSSNYEYEDLHELLIYKSPEPDDTNILMERFRTKI